MIKSEWEVKYFKTKGTEQYARLKRTYGSTTILIFVGKNGWNYKNETNEYSGGYPINPTNGYRDWNKGFGVAEYHVRISMNGPLMLTWMDFIEIDYKIREVAMEVAM